MCWPYESAETVRISTCKNEDLLHAPDFQPLSDAPTHTLQCAVSNVSSIIDRRVDREFLEYLLNAVYQELARRV